MPAQAPLDRLSSRDLYRQIDWLRDEWETADEYVIARQLGRLLRTFEHLPTRYWTQAEPLIRQLGWARVVNGHPWQQTLTALAGIVSAWNHDRPLLLDCPECGLTMRGHNALRTHRYVIHEVEGDA